MSNTLSNFKISSSQKHPFSLLILRHTGFQTLREYSEENAQSLIACVACSQHQNGGLRNFLNLSLCISPFSLGYKRGKMYKEWNQHYLQISHFIYLYIFIYLSV